MRAGSEGSMPCCAVLCWTGPDTCRQPALRLHTHPNCVHRHTGKYLARQTLALRGVVPMLAAPMSDGNGGRAGARVCALVPASAAFSGGRAWQGVL